MTPSTAPAPQAILFSANPARAEMPEGCRHLEEHPELYFSIPFRIRLSAPLIGFVHVSGDQVRYVAYIADIVDYDPRHHDDPTFAPLVKPQEWLVAAHAPGGQGPAHWEMSLIITRLVRFDYETLAMTTVNGDPVMQPPQRYYRVLEPAEWLASAEQEFLLQGFSTVPVAEDRRSRQGYLRNCAVRRAVERRAMEAAIAHYMGQGYQVEDTSATQPYDLRCRRPGEQVRVEVKGSQGEGEEVFLTAGEVEHAHSSGVRTDLFVWGRIQLVEGDDSPRGVGGQLVAHIENWIPLEKELTPTQYRYQVPGIVSP